MASGRQTTWRAILAAIVVAGGIGITWAVALHWLESVKYSLLTSRDQVYEDIYVAIDGTPVIGVESNALVNTVAISRRTLDGKSWPVDYEYWLGGSSLGPRNLVPRVIEFPLEWNDWNTRMIGGTDGRRPPTAWYVIRDDKLVGHCYLAGYDAFSKLPIGYIGRNGFRATAPAVADQFAIPATYERRLNTFVTSTQYLRWGIVWDHHLYQQGDPAPWLVFMLEADRMWEVDLRQRTARVVLESPGLISASDITALESTVHSLQPDGEARSMRSTPFKLAAANMQELSSVVQLPVDQDEKKPEFGTAVAVRSDDRIILYNSPSGNKREFLLPKTVPNAWINAYWTAPNQLLLRFDKGHWSGGPIQQLMWINAAGEIQREEEVKLAGEVPDPPRKMAWKYAAWMPVPILWLIGMVLGAPLFFVHTYRAADYASALASVGGIAWPPLVVVLAVAVVLTWLAMRLHRKYRRPASGVWAAFVFLLGLPGFFAYWLEHRRPKMEACAECGQVVPRDRNACAACNVTFRPPAPVGTEIFA